MKRLAFALACFGCFATPALAQMPDGACYVMTLDGDALSRQPERGVQTLTVEFRALTPDERATKGYWRDVQIWARMAGQGQARRDGAMGAVLSASAGCRAHTMTCWADDNRAHFALRFLEGGQMELRTRDFPVADYGGSMTASNLAEKDDSDTVYLLSPAPILDCALM